MSKSEPGCGFAGWSGHDDDDADLYFPRSRRRSTTTSAASPPPSAFPPTASSGRNSIASAPPQDRPQDNNPWGGYERSILRGISSAVPTTRPARRRSRSDGAIAGPAGNQLLQQSPPRGVVQQSPSASDLASVTSDRNSIRFQHVDNGEDWSDSSNESVNSNNHDLEVMDLRTGRSYPREVARMDAASIISISSNLSVDSETASRMYQVATAGDDGSDMPGHWEAMQAYPADATFTLHEGVGSVHEIENPLGESERA